MMDAVRVTFAQCYEQASKDFSAARAHNYRSAYRYLEPIADLPIRSIKAAQMQKCIDACQTTQQREIKTVCRKVFEYAMQQELVDRDPALYLHSNTVAAEIERDVFTPDQIRDLFSRTDIWWARVALILLYTGMRTKELQDLTPDDIDLDQKMIYIRKAKNKSSIRQIPIHDKILPLIDGLQFEQSHDALNYHLKKRYHRYAHDCRHTFTTRMRELGCDLLTLQILLGHTPQTITERVYTHISQEELREAVSALDYGV
jgi:integrase